MYTSSFNISAHTHTHLPDTSWLWWTLLAVCWGRGRKEERVGASNTMQSSNYVHKSFREPHLSFLKRACAFGFLNASSSSSGSNQQQTKMVSVVTENREQSTHLVIRLVEKALFRVSLWSMWSDFWNVSFSHFYICREAPSAGCLIVCSLY